ncbi:meckelin-like [Diadema antillarum]|uniref:meckelin-like n=1 Tax=Diadema antillarum TaxID=105358 RepID=UPI003A8865E4
MAPSLAFLVKYFLAIAVLTTTVSSYSFPYITKDQCNDNGEYYDFVELNCDACGENQVPATDGFSCQCTPYFKMTSNNGGPEVVCTPCPAGERATSDGWECIGCTINPVTTQCASCGASEIGVEYSITGELQANKTCVLCAAKTQPDSEDLQCERCHQSFIAVTGTCTCPQEGNVCFPDPLPVLPQGAFNVEFDILTSPVRQSWFLAEFLGEVQESCEDYYNFTACQAWGNMCVMQLYNVDSTACQNYRSAAGVGAAQIFGANNIDDWPLNMPWLYYGDGTTEEVLDQTDLNKVFSFNSSSTDSELTLVVAQYTANGTFLGVDSVTGGRLQFCKDTEERMDAAYSFATTYRSSCSLSARQFWDSYETVFFDMYMQFDDNGINKLFDIPVLITNFDPANEGSDRSQWRLTRRFFLVDNLSGQDVVDTPASAIRYASSIKLEVTLRDGTDGMIYPPLLRITYSQLAYEDYEAENSATVTFEVSYAMNQAGTFRSISIALGVFCALFLLYAMFKTNAWRRRAGIIIIDVVSMFKFLFFACGLIADAFVIVTIGVSLYWLLFFKRQDKVYLLLPTPAQSGSFEAYVIVAFVMKFIDVIHLLAVQCRTDIFLIDWERSRGRLVQGSAAPGSKASVAPISAWRSFFVANEWNELQEIRRSNPVFQIMAVLFFLEVVGLKNLTTTDPHSTVNPSSDGYIGDYAFVLRFGMAAGLYLLVGIAQYLFYTLFYERFVEDALRNFVDLCSMANISVFLLMQSNYGYYIHGRSVHGFADTSMKEIKQQLKREEDNLVGQRGLEPNSDQQTFEILLSSSFRERYNSIVLPLRTPGAARGAGAGNSDEKISEAYVSLNKFLSTFIDHGMADIDYIVKDKLLLEKILDMEFYDPTDKGFFFNDDGHAFQNAIFYGNESTLIIFELLLFCIVDLIFTNYVLAGVITYLGSTMLIKIRDGLGRSNVARKTLVDERFLI